ncbi:MAG: hypothetical protein HYT76_05970 [Deltaproteobacteria bacterium]|nr:hypothetical protein [Deltaproteobacteria bacterium]
MSNINKTMNIGGSAGANSVPQKSPSDEFSRTGKRDGVPSEYRSVEVSQKIAEAAEIRPQELLTRLSREDYQRHKEVVTDLETALSQVVDKKALEEGRAKGIVQFAREKLAGLQSKVNQEKNPAKKQLLLKQVQTIKNSIDAVKKVQAEMETKFEAQGPSDVPKTRLDLALNKLTQIYGEKIPVQEPAKIREVVIGRLQKNLQLLAEGRRKVAAELRQQIELRKSGKADEKRIKELQLEEQKFLRGEKLYSDTIVHVENWVRELEKGTIESELRQELSVGQDDESVATEEEGSGGTSEASAATPTNTPATGRPGGSRGRFVGISSAGGGEGTPYDDGDSDYIEMNRGSGGTTIVQSQSAGGASRPSDLMIDIALSSTNTAVLENAGRVRAEWQRTKRVVDQIMRRLLAGDYRVLDLALIMLSHQAAMSTVTVGAKMVKALEEQDRQQQQVVTQLDQLSAENPNFASQASSANLQVNKIATDRQATMNLLRTALTSMEEIQNITKSYLDIQGAQIRHLSRFNT